MTPSEDALLSELEGILKEAEAKVTSERAEGINQEFQEVEKSMFMELGTKMDCHQLYSISVVPEGEQRDEALSEIGNEQVHLVEGTGSIDGHDADTLIRLALRAEAGNIYEALENKYLALEIALDPNSIGVLLRMAAKATHISGEKAHDHTDEPQEVIITTMLMSDHVYVATRFLDKVDEVHYQTIHAEDYKGEHELINALLAFFVGTKAIVEINPEVAKALHKDLSRKREKETSNNNQQSKEDNAQ